MRFCSVLHVFLVLMCQLHYIKMQRRIVGGKPAEGEIHRHMAYLIKAPVSEAPTYDAWICGGAIVSHRAIVTSAACILDVKYMYAVTGYNKYVQTSRIKIDECTKNARKKVIFSCVPITHKFSYHNVANWTNADIGIVFVESDFNFKNIVQGCSWVPEMIPLNEVLKCQDEGTNAVVLGFGHQEKWRQVLDTKDYNEEQLRYASVLVMNKDECKKHYLGYPALHDIIDKFMICSNSAGMLDDFGDPVNLAENSSFTCVGKKCLRTHLRSRPIKEEKEDHDTQSHHESRIKTKEDYYDEQKTVDSGNSAESHHRSRYNNLRRDILNATGNLTDNTPYRRYSEDMPMAPGICQNDHGGPLISWCGTNPYLIGVASVFLVTPNEKRCKGPYLYTSAYCNREFLKCVIVKIGRDISGDGNKDPDEMDDEERRRQKILDGYAAWYEKNQQFCELPAEKKGFDVKSRRISWASHPDGPAQTELDEDLFERPQIPLNAYS